LIEKHATQKSGIQKIFIHKQSLRKIQLVCMPTTAQAGATFAMKPAISFEALVP
jgi:hypothetical protein